MRHCRNLVAAGTLAWVAGCATVPMSYREWQEEQVRRQTADSTGIPFKSKRQVLAEGEELKRIAAEVTFP